MGLQESGSVECVVIPLKVGIEMSVMIDGMEENEGDALQRSC
jgi:hypothetical protein